MTKIIEETIETILNGQIYIGKRILKGTRIRYQTIKYKDLSKMDSTMIKKGREATALFKAKTILDELVKEYHGFPLNYLSK